MVVVNVIGQGPPMLLTKAEVTAIGFVAGGRRQPGVAPELDVPVYVELLRELPRKIYLDKGRETEETTLKTQTHFIWGGCIVFVYTPE